MPDPIIRQMATYWNNKKAAECNSTHVSFMMNGEALYGQDGIIAYSDGRAKMRVTVSEVTPIDGSFSTKDIETMLLKKKMPISFILGGRFFRSTMTVITADYKSDSEKNVTTGEIVLESKMPTIV
jgi:hypothetical protein